MPSGRAYGPPSPGHSPITDPRCPSCALGSFATVYLSSPVAAEEARMRIAAIPGIELVLPRATLARTSSSRPDRVGDLVVVSERLTVSVPAVIGHDLSGPRRAAALAWRRVRAAGASDREPARAGAPGGTSVATTSMRSTSRSITAMNMMTN